MPFLSDAVVTTWTSLAGSSTSAGASRLPIFVLLVGLLVEGEVLRVAGSPTLRTLVRASRVIVVPLLLTFLVAIGIRLGGL